MKILQLISSYGYYGAENVVLELCKSLQSKKIASVIGIFYNSHNPHIEIVDFTKKNNVKTKLFKCNGQFDLNVFRSIAHYIKIEKIDLIHSHGYKANFYGYIIAKVVKKPIVTTCHNWIADDFKTKFYYNIDKLLLPWFNNVIAVSDVIEKELKKIIKSSRIRLIYNGIETSKFNNGYRDNRSEFRISNRDFVIGTVARFTSEKGLFNLLLAAKKIIELFKNVTFLIVGDGELMNDLTNKAEFLDIKEKVIFTGQRDDMPQIYSTMDLFVLPSLNEGLPIVLLEAMASKKPVIATKVGAIPKVIEDNKSGILIEPGSVNDIISSVSFLINDRDKMLELAFIAQKRINEVFSSDTMTEKYIGVYKNNLE